MNRCDTCWVTRKDSPGKPDPIDPRTMICDDCLANSRVVTNTSGRQYRAAIFASAEEVER